MKDMIMAVLLGLIFSAVLCPLGIPFLHKLKFGQQVREDGPQAHLKKQGTPTMGGIMILAAMAAASLFFLGRYPAIAPILFVTLGFGLVGFTDDYIKVVRKHSEGLNPKQKLIGQLLITLIFIGWQMKTDPQACAVLIPFTGGIREGFYWNMGLLYIPFAVCVMLGTDNGVNFTDGLDGLCSTVTVVTAAFFGAVSVKEGQGISPVAGAAAGSLMGFLLYNVYPAKVFMGDTGSLALGGFAAASALSLKLPFWLPLVGMIYLAEVLSVIIQVGYFKKTGGKRFFKMAPIHHHFELCGWSETRVVAVFSILTAALCLIGYLLV